MTPRYSTVSQFYGIFGLPKHDPYVTNAEIIDGASVTKSELREYIEMTQTIHSSTPILPLAQK